MTIKEISKMVGVSPATVSLALNNKEGVSEETKKIIWHIANKYGYVKKGVMKKNILFIKYIGNGAAIEHNGDFVARIIDAIESAVSNLNYNLVIKNIEAGYFDKEIHSVNFDDFEGIILLGTELEDHEGKLISNINIPVVAVDHMFEDYDVDSVVMDNYGGIFTAVKYLYDLGHREIGYIDSNIQFSNFNQRRLGYFRALDKLNLTYKTSYIKIVAPNLEGAYNTMLTQLEKNQPLPTAFIAANDTIAIGTIKALKEKDINVPEEISIIGFDDIPFGKILDKPLTTMQVDKEQIGYLAVSVLHNKINKVSQGHIKTLTRTNLIERESTLPPATTMER